MLLLASRVSRAGGLASLRVGVVGRRRAQGAALVGGVALMASKEDTAACSPGQKCRVASYNVLSSKLCEPGYFVKCAKENLDPPTRLKRVQALLEQETKKKAVVCLQEVSREWSGDLHAFFAKRGYQFTTGLYGNPFNGYMGVAVAWPQDKYELINVDCARLSDDVQEARKKWERPVEVTGIRKFASNLKKRVGNALTALTSSLEYERPPFDGWKEARKKHNVLVTATLKPKHGEAFCVGTYHMPCLFGSVDKERVMVIHAALAARRVQQVAAGKPYVLCGDFNVKPYDACYQMLTQGSLSGEFNDYNPTKPEGDVVANTFAATVTPPLESAYVLANGKEPDFTNFAYTKNMGADMDAFVETLDYVFLGPGWRVNGVLETVPAGAIDRSKPYPTLEQPSDHCMIAADLERE